MQKSLNRQILLANRPVGMPKASDFRLEESSIPTPAGGQVLCKTLYLSLDPYMRGRMSPSKSYAPSVEINEVMTGGTVGEVIESKDSEFHAGDIVFGYGGWQDYWVLKGKTLNKVDPDIAPISTATGVLGMPGVTAYTGLLNIGKPKKGETVVVAAACGAVGSVVGQIAKIKGARSVGIAGSPEKCEYATNTFQFDHCLDHNSMEFVTFNTPYQNILPLPFARPLDNLVHGLVLAVEANRHRPIIEAPLYHTLSIRGTVFNPSCGRLKCGSR